MPLLLAAAIVLLISLLIARAIERLSARQQAIPETMPARQHTAARPAP